MKTAIINYVLVSCLFCLSVPLLSGCGGGSSGGSGSSASSDQSAVDLLKDALKADQFFRTAIEEDNVRDIYDLAETFTVYIDVSRFSSEFQAAHKKHATSMASYSAARRVYSSNRYESDAYKKEAYKKILNEELQS